MIGTTCSQAREQLESLMDRAVAEREVILVRRRGAGAAAIPVRRGPGPGSRP